MLKEMLVSIIANVEHIIVGTVFAVINLLLRPAKGRLSIYALEFFISVIVATLIGMASLELGLGKGLSLIMVACSALLAKDVLTFIVGFGDYVEENKESLYKSLFKAIFKRAGKDGP